MPEPRSEKRDAILAAAREEFQALGFGGARMDQIAARAEVSKRTVYKHFSSKEDLFAQIIADLHAAVLESTNLEYDSTIPLRDALREMATREVDLLTSQDFLEFARVAVSTTLLAPNLLPDGFMDIERVDSGVVRWIRAAMADGQLESGSPQIAAEEFFALIKAFALWPQLLGHQPIPGPRQQRDIIERAIDLFLARYEIRA